MKTFKHVISVNTAILGGVERDKAFYSKYIGDSCFNYWGMKMSEVRRILGFGNTGRKVICEDIARSLNVGLDIAKKILADVETSI